MLVRIKSSSWRWAFVMAIAVGLLAVEVGRGPQAQEEPATRTWTVCAEGCDFSSVQEAIDVATDGDVVRVLSGSYRENLVIQKAITLEAVPQDDRPVVLAPKDFERPTLLIKRPGVLKALEGVVVRGFEIRGVEWIPKSPLPRAGVTVRIEDVGVVLEDNEIGGGIGVSAFAFGGTRIAIRDNAIVESGAEGIQLIGNGRFGLIGNRVENKFGGLVVGGLARVELRGNTLQNNKIGLVVGGYGRVLAEENAIQFNVVGVQLTAFEPTVEFNRNEIARNIRWGLTLYHPSCVEEFEEEAAFRGVVKGRDNVMFDNGNGNLCPQDYPWPEGFVAKPKSP